VAGKRDGNQAVAGVLSLQGCVDRHLEILAKIGAKTVKVRSEEDLKLVERIILPGGESSTMLKLLTTANLFDPLKEFLKTHPSWGVCAGAILLAKEVTNPAQKSLAVMNISAERNYYGSQRDSFKGIVNLTGKEASFEADFIRAPLLAALDDSVAILATHNGQAVWLQQGRSMVTSFHTELGSNTTLHEQFLKL
jgi:5'-phosphate synthase pdxT subunit